MDPASFIHFSVLAVNIRTTTAISRLQELPFNLCPAAVLLYSAFLYLAAFSAVRMLLLKLKGTHHSANNTVHPNLKPYYDSSYNSSYNTVSILIETNRSTLWEGPIMSGPRLVTLGTGEYYGSIPCNDQNSLLSGANPGSPLGNTPTDALDAAANIRGSTHYREHEGDLWLDFHITNIGGLANWGNGIAYSHWGIAINWQPLSVWIGLWLSGCQQLLKSGDGVLWAYMPIGPSWDSYLNPEFFLELTSTTMSVKKGKSFTVGFVDGRISNAA